jgi:hypothetical protein
MSCFNHSNQEAVGGCKNCGRALCKDCIALELYSIACKNRCEEKVKAIDSFLQKSIITKYNTTLVTYFVVAFMLAALSILFYQINDFEPFGIFMGVLALFLFGNAFRILFRNSS